MRPNVCSSQSVCRYIIGSLLQRGGIGQFKNGILNQLQVSDGDIVFLLPSIESIVALLVIWLMPKRLTRKEIYITFFVMVALTHTVDVLLNAVLKLYYIGTPRMDWQAWAIETVLEPAFGVIILNFMPLRRKPFFIYLICVVLVSVLNELLNVHIRYINYRHWNIWYSATVYLLGTLFLRWHIHYLRSQKK